VVFLREFSNFSIGFPGVSESIDERSKKLKEIKVEKNSIKVLLFVFFQCLLEANVVTYVCSL
jgi:hypothetical protein